MRLQGLPAAIASLDGRVERLVRQRCPIEGDILIKIVEIGPIGVAIERPGWSAICENDVVTCRLKVWWS